MDSSSHPPSLTCELRIIKAININTKPRKQAFIRCYLSAGNSTRVALQTKPVPPEADVITWDQAFSLTCASSIGRLRRETLVFELRWRGKSAPLIGRIRGSELVGRAEVSWNDVVEAGNMEVEKWVAVTGSGALRVGVKVLECSERILEREKGGRGCMDSGCSSKSCVGFEFFAIEAALEAL